MKLIIQIPCYNEEKTLETTVRDLPDKIDGIDSIETLIINDGSTDRTLEIARKIKINHIISFVSNRGLARAFSAGIEESLKLGADIIINTDADNQYYGQDIPKLIKPIVDGKADVVVGDRQTDKIPHFSWIKKKLQKYGSRLVRRLSETKVKDAVSGFRAYSREAALRINTLMEFSHTVENLIQLGDQKIKIISTPIRTNKILRKSRLFTNVPNFLALQSATILRTYATYKALKVFTVIGLIIVLPGLFGFIRFLYFYFTGSGLGHVQSLIFSSALLFIGFLIFMFGIIADLISNNRKLIEKALYKIKKMELEKKRDEN